MKAEVIEKLAALMTAALGLVAALAWNGAIQAIFKELFGAPDQITAMVIYAVVITGIAVILIIWIAKAEEHTKRRFTRKQEKELKEEIKEELKEEERKK
ncbi:MAG: DUF5654 family protein [Candidatus Woesearchaeota archaeon]